MHYQPLAGSHSPANGRPREGPHRRSDLGYYHHPGHYHSQQHFQYIGIAQPLQYSAQAQLSAPLNYQQQQWYQPYQHYAPFPEQPSPTARHYQMQSPMPVPTHMNTHTVASTTRQYMPPPQSSQTLLPEMGTPSTASLPITSRSTTPTTASASTPAPSVVTPKPIRPSHTDISSVVELADEPSRGVPRDTYYPRVSRSFLLANLPVSRRLFHSLSSCPGTLFLTRNSPLGYHAGGGAEMRSYPPKKSNSHLDSTSTLPMTGP